MSTPSRITITGARDDASAEILTTEALDFIVGLDDAFAERRCTLLAQRRQRRQDLAAGMALDFLPETKEIRSDDSWQVASLAPGLIDRRVEITGPIDRTSAVNALNSGAQVWLADLEDATSPTWHNVLQGQANLVAAIEGRLDFTSADGLEHYVGAEIPTIVVRPRGWHLVEKNVRIDGRPVSASLFDAGLYLYHCAQRQIDRGSGPYLYLPKLESHLEARLWNDVFVAAQEALGIPRGTIRATVLVETLTAAFEMDEILYELREHAAGLNAGRWDYLFSVIKGFRTSGHDYLLPDRAHLTMTAPFMRAYTELLVQTCHRRGASAVGGLAAFVPDEGDPKANERALGKIRADKRREAHDGFDGSWVAHADLVPICSDAFTRVLDGRPHQIDNLREDVWVTASDLLDLGSTHGTCTRDGLRNNVAVALQYLDAWLGGTGAVPIHGLMEDLSTAEISRTQLWQWLRLGVQLDDGSRVTPDLIRRTIAEEAGAGMAGARQLLEEAVLAEEMPEFLSCVAYAEHLV